MNTPNKLTLARFIITPFFLGCLLLSFPAHIFVALALFIIASLTDMADGKLARRRNQVTDFGKFLDPIADKLLTTTALIGFIALRWSWGIVWVTFVILGRDFLVTSLRLMAAGRGTVIAANIWGKIKTALLMVTIILTLLVEALIETGVLTGAAASGMRWAYSVLLWICAVAALLSCVVYLFQNKQFINPKEKS